MEISGKNRFFVIPANFFGTFRPPLNAWESNPAVTEVFPNAPSGDIGPAEKVPKEYVVHLDTINTMNRQRREMSKDDAG